MECNISVSHFRNLRNRILGIYFIISPYNFKLLFLRTNLTYRVITPHSRKLRNSVWPFDHKLWAEDVRIISWNQDICKKQIWKFYGQDPDHPLCTNMFLVSAFYLLTFTSQRKHIKASVLFSVTKLSFFQALNQFRKQNLVNIETIVSLNLEIIMEIILDMVFCIFQQL